MCCRALNKRPYIPYCKVYVKLQFIFPKIRASRLGRPFCLLTAAATVVVVVVAAVIAAAAAVAEQEDQNDDPPPVVAAEAVADAVIVAHKITSAIGFELCRSFHGIPKASFCALQNSEITVPAERPPERSWRQSFRP